MCKAKEKKTKIYLIHQTKKNVFAVLKNKTFNFKKSLHNGNNSQSVIRSNPVRRKCSDFQNGRNKCQCSCHFILLSSFIAFLTSSSSF